MANRDLLKEAIADAKAVKETAIANAKAALEEAFTPMLREKLAAKLAEMDKIEEEDSVEEAKHNKEEVKETYSVEEDEMMEDDSMMEEESLSEEDETTEGKEKTDEIDLEELLRELEAMEEGDYVNEEDDTMEEGKMKKDDKKKDLKEEEEGLINDPKKSTSHGNVAEEETEEEEIDLENMSEDDLKKFIEDVIADMVQAGELEAGEGAEGEEEESEEEESEEEVEINERKKYGGNKGDVPASKRGDKKDTAEEEGVEDYKKKVKEMKHELEEAYNALSIIKTELNEVNLFNAKLLYTNKIFKAKNLTESQKVKVLAAFDKAASVKEAKLVFETLSEGFKEKKSPVNESLLRGSASKPAGIVERKPIMEADAQVLRMQKLAGIIK